MTSKTWLVRLVGHIRKVRLVGKTTKTTKIDQTVSTRPIFKTSFLLKIYWKILLKNQMINDIFGKELWGN